MSDVLLYVLVFIAVVILYTIVKIREHMKKSDEQWKAVDKTKLREWDDDEDW